MKYLKETVDPQDTEILVESEGSKKSRFITGPFMMFNKQNKNGRLYPEKIMDKAVLEYKADYIDKSRALGELNHPVGRVQVDPERACIMITELKKDGTFYMGKAKVLSTPLGKILESLLEDGVRVGVSSRGYGSVSSQGNVKTVKEDFRLTAAADIVHDPSVHDAYVESLMEQKDFILVNGILVESDYDHLQRIKISRPSKEYQDAVMEQFRTLLSGF